jgi:hypothetical protein
MMKPLTSEELLDSFDSDAPALRLTIRLEGPIHSVEIAEDFRDETYWKIEESLQEAFHRAIYGFYGWEIWKKGGEDE